MPEVLVKAILICGKRKLSTNILLNSGGLDTELVVPKSLAGRLRIESCGKSEVSFGGRKFRADVGKVEMEIRDSETGEKRTSVVEAIVLPDKTLAYPLLGVLGLEKLRIILDLTTGKAIFK